MKLTETLKKRLLPVTVGAAAVAFAASGVAYATTPSTTASPPAATTSISTASAVAPAAQHPHLKARVAWLARHTVHAQLEIHTKAGFETIVIDRGKLKTDSSATITIVRADHVAVSAAITSSTKFVGLTESELAPGDGVVLVQHAGRALYVAARAPTTAPNSAS